MRSFSGDRNRERVAAQTNLFREGLAAVIENQDDMTLVATASNGREAVQSFQKHRPDITLMDLRLPELNGIEATIAIRLEFAEARVIVVSTFDGDAEIRSALQAGACGYMFKSLLSKTGRGCDA